MVIFCNLTNPNLHTRECRHGEEEEGGHQVESVDDDQQEQQPETRQYQSRHHLRPILSTCEMFDVFLSEINDEWDEIETYSDAAKMFTIGCIGIFFQSQETLHNSLEIE